MLLVILLMACAGLAFWVQEKSSRSAENRHALTISRNQINRDLTQLSEAFRGLLLDPQSENDKKHRKEAEADLQSDLKVFLDSGDTDLAQAAKKLKAFVDGRLSSFQTEVFDLFATNPAAAISHYKTNVSETNVLGVAVQQEQLFSALAVKVGAVQIADSQRAATTALVGGIGIAVLALAAVVVGFRQSSAIAEPLNRLVGSLERMRQGDFTQRLTSDRQDEFGILSHGLNRLADELSELVGQVQRSGIQVNTTATQIAATAREQQSTSHEIAATTAEIGATSKEISATSKELVKTMNEVSQVAEETATLAGSGQSSIARMEATMRQIMDASGSITSKLAVLSEKTTNINSVVTTITKVADQTNLLSLNAAIEAEKAGEYGLGFAVVAMEIRRLADQTAVATYDIEKMVKEMQSAVAAGVMGMDKFSEEVRRGVEEIRQVSTHLAQIIHQVQTLTPRFQTVNEGMHAQATGAQQISETLIQLSEAAQQTAESLRQSNQAIEQLNGAARGLQTSVARFKLDGQLVKS
jgi:methyl-accepting chemotaxis protein WspA